MSTSNILKLLLALALCAGASACSSTKHVPQGKYLLNNVDIDIESNKEISSAQLYNYLRQLPNHEVLGFAKLQLATYNLSGSDTTKWYNRWARKLGQPPVIYDQSLAEASVVQLQRALNNQGYLDAKVTFDTLPRPDKKKMDLRYNVHPGKPHVISKIDFDIADPAIDSAIMADPKLISVRPGDHFDRNNLEQMRTSIAQRLQQLGYYSFTKDCIGFVADTTANSKLLELTLVVRPPRLAPGNAADEVTSQRYAKYYFGTVTYVTDAAILTGEVKADTVHFRDITVLYGPDRYLAPSVLYDNCYITPGQHYSNRAIDFTYQALGRLGILKFVNIQLVNAGIEHSRHTLNVVITLDRTKKQGITAELEGTNSEGDLGFGVGVTYQHRNLAHGAQQLNAKLRTSYESLSGDVEGLLNNRYSEYAAEVGITFPKFEAPLLSRQFKRRFRATTEFALSFNYQERPEYTRIIAGGAWKYNWANRQNTERRTLDFIDINYVYLPRSTINFIDAIAPTNPLLRYSYEDHFIMRIGYTYRRTNRRIPSAMERSQRQPYIFSLRASAETAGNLLYALSSITHQQRTDGAYRLFGIQYAQYAKAEFDYSLTRNLDSRNSLAFRFGAGIGVPYGNSSMIPFEKRFYAGGANSVRGWGARALGPGAYISRNDAVAFINQCGDISLLLSAEYRAKLFWVFEGALFVDAGNIWTIHNYENQPRGMFHFNNFYKEIAGAYGLGLRMDFTYFLLRLDLGIKAHNPAYGEQQWPLLHPKWGRDATLHFAVGYPF